MIEDKVSLEVLSVLQGDAPLTALIADGPGSYGSAVFHAEAPEGNFLPCVVYALVPDQVSNPQGLGEKFANVQVVIQAYQLGRSFPTSIIQAVKDALAGHVAVRDDLVIGFEYLGDVRPVVGNIGNQRIRSRGVRFMARVSVAE